MAPAAGPSAREVREAPANIAGLFRAPCDPLVLAYGGSGKGVGGHLALPGLTGLVDWRLAGRLARHLLAATTEGDAPLLLPRTPLLPAGRLLLLRRGAFTPAALADCIRALATGPAGLCPEDFDWRPADVAAAFAGLPVILYRPGAGAEP